jgi:hypothetical protein
MNLTDDRSLANTKRKLQLLEKSYQEAQADMDGGEHVRELELESLTRLINQLKEEIARYECRQPAQH